jgi:hypothetical protein
MINDELVAEPGYGSVVRDAGLSAESIFTDPRVRVWRSLPDRENATIDLAIAPRQRWHIKRYPKSAGRIVDSEVEGSRLLASVGVPVAPVICHGRLADGRSFVAIEDLAGFTPLDKWIGRDHPFEPHLKATADLAAKMHAAGVHHRDLYMCHFMVRAAETGFDLRVIDTARVDRMWNPLTRFRWVVKDLAQFWYSAKSASVSADQRDRWLERYAEQRGPEVDIEKLADAVRQKAGRIARHDVKLNRLQPTRHVSIPD